MTGPDVVTPDRTGDRTPRFTRPLGELIANRRWVRRERPFPHVVAANVFVPDFYAELDTEFRRIETEHPEAFQRSMAGYDASGAEVSTYQDGPLGVFLTREFHDLVAGLFGVTGTGDVTASLHHHDPGGASGWPHNDLNPGWFPGPRPGPDEIQVPDQSVVSYHTGKGPGHDDARANVRAVSVLFYLGNPEWSAGDGGETGLYAHGTDRAPAATVAPVNNSIVAFECTPYSWHGFVSNKVLPRNSVVMWVHRDKREVDERWGADSIVPW